MKDFFKKAYQKSSGGILVYLLVALTFIFGPKILDGYYDYHATIWGLTMIIIATVLSLVYYK